MTKCKAMKNKKKIEKNGAKKEKTSCTGEKKGRSILSICGMTLRCPLCNEMMIPNQSIWTCVPCNVKALNCSEMPLPSYFLQTFIRDE